MKITTNMKIKLLLIALSLGVTQAFAFEESSCYQDIRILAERKLVDVSRWSKDSEVTISYLAMLNELIQDPSIVNDVDGIMEMENGPVKWSMLALALFAKQVDPSELEALPNLPFPLYWQIRLDDSLSLRKFEYEMRLIYILNFLNSIQGNDHAIRGFEVSFSSQFLGGLFYSSTNANYLLDEKFAKLMVLLSSMDDLLLREMQVALYEYLAESTSRFNPELDLDEATSSTMGRFGFASTYLASTVYSNTALYVQYLDALKLLVYRSLIGEGLATDLGIHYRLIDDVVASDTPSEEVIWQAFSKAFPEHLNRFDLVNGSLIPLSESGEDRIADYLNIWAFLNNPSD